MRQLSEQEQIRRKALEQLKKLGINPYPAEAYPVSHKADEIKANFKDDEKQIKAVTIAGRLMSRRIMGKASFAELQDSSGRIQLYVSRDDLAEGDDFTLYNDVFKKLLDIGDYIGVVGEVFKTKMGEITIHVKKLTVLSKALRPLPIVKADAEGNIHDAFTDPEQRYRQRYLDLTVNPQVKDVFVKRSKMISAMREFFDKKGWLEVETPILQSIHGGAAARPFKTHHNSLDIPLYLRIANELYLKRLIIGGFEGVYEIGKMFRNEGMDRTHNPEFTSMEIYIANKDYYWMMEMVESCLAFIAEKVVGSTQVTVKGKTIDFKGPYKRLPLLDAISEKVGQDISLLDRTGIADICRKYNIEVDDSMGRGKLIDELFGETVEPELIQPTYITDYPIEMTPLAKKHREKAGLVERFELFVNGKEIANAYSELNDPIDQRERFEKQLELAKKGDDEAMALDEDFLKALEYGMPPTSGLGIGMDRLAMLLTDNVSIQEVLFFPQMKPLPQQSSRSVDNLTEEAQAVLKALGDRDKILIDELRSKLELSNKKWDKAIKLLRKEAWINVTKEGDEIWVIKED